MAGPGEGGWTRRGRRAALLAAAAALTLANAAKPLHIDDTYYVFHARQAARAPLDPHGFTLFWHEVPEPAGNRVAPPVVPYWLAVIVAVLPDAPWAWKLWLFPFAAVLVFAWDALLRRLAPGLEGPMLLLLVASPAVLPGLNLMVDVPAAALLLLAVVCFLHASDAWGDERRSPAGRRAAGLVWAVAAGMAGAAAAQTKYTGLTAPAVWLAWALLHRRLRLWAVATAVAVALFCSWEAFLALSYGGSHFLRHLGRRVEGIAAKVPLLVAWPALLGAAAPGAVVLALRRGGIEGRRRHRDLMLAGAGASCGALVASRTSTSSITVAFAALGGAVMVFLAFTSAASLRRDEPGPRRASLFLVAWLAIEGIGYLALSPFPAMRRLLAFALVALLLLARACVRGARAPGEARRRAWRAARVTAAAGVLFAGIDLVEARAQRTAALAAVSWVKERDPAARPYFTGHWGFQHYAQSAGGRPVVLLPGRWRTLLKAGDWLILPSARVDRQQGAVDERALAIAHEIAVDDVLPWTTVPGYYGGYDPLARCSRPRLKVAVYRVVADAP